MKIREEIETETTVEVDEVVTRIAMCPWCEQDFDPEEAVEIHREPSINRFDLWQSILGGIITSSEVDPRKLTMREMEIHRKATTSGPDNKLPNLPKGAIHEVDLSKFRIRGDILRKIIKAEVEDSRMISKGTIRVCPQCADSIMGVEG